MCHSTFEINLFGLAYALAFFGAFRVSEVVAASTSGQSGGLELADLSWADDAIQVFLRKSKTDQGRNGVCVRMAATPGTGYCPVTLARIYLEARPRTAQPNLLVHADGSPLTRGQFTCICKRALEQLGEDPARFTSHSFRIGAATTAASMGLPEATIKGVGRWKSDCFQCYVRPQLV